MATFPEVKPSYGYLFIPQFKTDKLGPTDGDFTQRRRRRSSPLYRVEMTYANLSATDERTLFEFILARYGSWDSFVVAIGSTDGTADQTFNIPARDVDNETVYVAGTSTSSYTITTRGGTNGQDLLTLTGTLTSGQAVTMDYDGKKYLSTCIFEDDSIGSAIVSYQRYRFAKITVLEVNS